MDFSHVTACGESCVDCRKKKEGICPGCIEADGYVPEWAESGRCRVHTCVKAHNALFCGVCAEFPCQEIPAMMPWDSNRVDHLRRLAEQYRARKKP